MKLQQRIELLEKLGFFLSSGSAEFDQIKQQAFIKNGWFTNGFVDLQVNNICSEFLQKDKLEKWAAHYHLDDNIAGKNIGVVMAGNIPLVGFHDFLAVFLSGHHQTIKLSSKDDVLLRFIVEKMNGWDPAMATLVAFAELLKGCDAYIATGSNNSARYFDHYFGKYPSIIRRNRTSVAVISGKETAADLDGLADDVHLFFGLGCRNVTKICVPEGYDFVPMLTAFDKYAWFGDHNKYRNNYDYYLSLLIMNNRFYMTSQGKSIILSEEPALFSPISVLNYQFYKSLPDTMAELKDNPQLQCLVGSNALAFGSTQTPGLMDYADGVDTMQFLLAL